MVCLTTLCTIALPRVSGALTAHAPFKLARTLARVVGLYFRRPSAVCTQRSNGRVSLSDVREARRSFLPGRRRRSDRRRQDKELPRSGSERVGCVAAGDSSCP